MTRFATSLLLAALFAMRLESISPGSRREGGDCPHAGSQGHDPVEPVTWNDRFSRRDATHRAGPFGF